jgi:hypothetical protein
VALVHAHPTTNVLVGDLRELDSEIARERAGQALGAQLRSDGLVGLPHGQGSVPNGTRYGPRLRPSREVGTLDDRALEAELLSPIEHRLIEGADAVGFLSRD